MKSRHYLVTLCALALLVTSVSPDARTRNAGGPHRCGPERLSTTTASGQEFAAGGQAADTSALLTCRHDSKRCKHIGYPGKHASREGLPAAAARIQGVPNLCSPLSVRGSGHADIARSAGACFACAAADRLAQSRETLANADSAMR